MKTIKHYPGFLNLAAGAGMLAAMASAPGLCSAFDDGDFDPQGNGTKGNMKIGTYKTSADTLATCEGSGYFSNTFVSTTMKTGDLLVVNASDGVGTYKLTVSGTTVTVAAVPGGGGLVTSADSDVTLPDHGVVTMPTTAASAQTLPDPSVGAELTIIKGGSTTTITTVIPSTTTVFIGATGSNRKLSFDAAEEAVILKGLSSTRWGIASNVGSVAVATT